MSLRISQVFLLFFVSTQYLVTSQNFGGFNNKKTCKAYTCKNKNKVAVPKRRLKLTAGGCSELTNSMGGSFGTSGNELLLESCCNMYQACLSICGMREKTCMTDFTTCMDATCAKQTKEADQDKCKTDMGLYKMLIQIGDCKKYDEKQVTNCRCVDEKKVEINRKETLMNFWNKYNTKNKKKTEKDANKVLKKYGQTPKKFAKLVYRLIKKYPKAITIERSQQHRAMEELIKRSKRGDFKAAPHEDKSSSSGSSSTGKTSNSDEEYEIVDANTNENQEEDDDEETLNLDEM